MSSQFGPDYVRAIAPYQGGRPIADVAREFGLDENRIVKLASNENPLGMPESARQAMLAAAADAGRYPDGNGFALKATLTEKYNVPADWITLGNGSNDILELAAHAFVQPGQSVIFAQYSFAIYPLATQAVGGRAMAIAAKDFGHDLDAMADAIADDTRLIFVANPNNPTGTFINGAQIQKFLQRVPPDVVIVLDEAYMEFLAPELQYDSIAWVSQYPNLLVSRSMSKVYGLAGLRIGYGIAQPGITDLLNRIRQPFNVNSLAQAAAIAALNDTEFVARSAALNAAGYRQLITAFEGLKLPYIPSCGNFVMVKVGDDNDAGARVNLALLKQGVIVRPVGNYGLPQWLRVSIGLPQENEIFIAALKTALAK